MVRGGLFSLALDAARAPPYLDRVTPAETFALIARLRAPYLDDPDRLRALCHEAAAALEATLPRTAAGADVLARLLLGLFSVDELRRAARFSLPRTFARLPAGAVVPAAFAEEAAVAALEVGEADRLFAVCIEERPRRRAEILAVQQAVRAAQEAA